MPSTIARGLRPLALHRCGRVLAGRGLARVVSVVLAPALLVGCAVSASIGSARGGAAPVETACSELRIHLGRDRTPIEITYPAHYFGECPAVLVLPAAGRLLAKASLEPLAEYGFVVATTAPELDLRATDVDALVQVLQEHPRVSPTRVFVAGGPGDPLADQADIAAWIAVDRTPGDFAPPSFDFEAANADQELPQLRRWLLAQLDRILEEGAALPPELAAEQPFF